MIGSHFSRSFSMAVICLAAATAVVSACTVRICHAIGTTALSAWRFVVDVFKNLAPNEPPKPMPGLAVQLIAAKQYLLRQIKRQRPDVTPGWRMAPST